MQSEHVEQTPGNKFCIMQRTSNQYTRAALSAQGMRRCIFGSPHGMAIFPAKVCSKAIPRQICNALKLFKVSSILS
jgi:hypothetical protein